MDQPLGRAVGNALEVIEAVEMLRGRAPADYTEITLALTAEMLVLGGEAKDEAEARVKLLESIKSGAALEQLKQIISAQAGDPEAVEDYARLPTASGTTDVPAPASGFVTKIDCEAVGLAAVALGAGRATTGSEIDPAVGFTLHKKVGEAVTAGEPMVRIHFNDSAKVEDVRARLLTAYQVGPEAPAPRPLVIERLS
jgi:pyrimidine-nucleoside phosphorylase